MIGMHGRRVLPLAGVLALTACGAVNLPAGTVGETVGESAHVRHTVAVHGHRPTNAPCNNAHPCTSSSSTSPPTTTTSSTTTASSTTSTGTSSTTSTSTSTSTSSTATSSSAWACTTPDPRGVCGPYPETAGIDGATEVDANDWSGDPAYRATLYANGPADWQAVADTAGDGGAILAYPNTWIHDVSGPVDAASSVVTSWSTSFPHDSATVGWAAYDLWFNDWATEVMVQTDISAGPAYACAPAASATFGGQPWHLCVFGSERVWKHGTDDAHLINQASGSLDVLPFLAWMEHHGYLPAGSTWTAASFGFEVANTGGAAAAFRVDGLTWHTVSAAATSP